MKDVTFEDATHNAILSQLALGNQIANANLAQQVAVAHQQAMSALTLAVVGKAVEIIAAIPPSSEGSAQQVTHILQLVEQLLKTASTPPAALQPPTR